MDNPITDEGKALGERIEKYLELAQKAGNGTDYMELDIEEIEAGVAGYGEENWLTKDITDLIAVVKQQKIMIAMLVDNLDSLQGGIVRFLEGIEQGVKDGTVIYTDEPK